MQGSLPHLSFDLSSRPWFSTACSEEKKEVFESNFSNRSFRIEVLEVFEAFEAAPNTRDLQNIEAL